MKKEDLEMLVPLKEEHIPDIHARLALHDFYEQQAIEEETAANRAQYTYLAFEQSFTVAVMLGLSKEEPQELARVATLIARYRAEHAAHEAACNNFKQTASALREAFTLWLAHLYHFDAVRDHYELDLDNRVLRRKAHELAPQEEKESQQ